MTLRFALATTAAMLSCGISSHAAVPADAAADFSTRSAIPASSRYFSLPDKMSAEERDAMQFLYAYLPLPDITDYQADFYLDNVRTALRTRKEMPWGSKIPDREFYHFVLPVRVNNENLDNSRQVFFDELKERVKGMSMTDAVLEVNHWCHEKVTYQPSDGRTSSPLASVRSAIGRCGEESTFTVAALRAIGIPARQVYTTRWAHTDDNHAWVEVWVDGNWHFLGACEPEPILDLGWFNAPASRGMIMNTKVFGKYDGPEEQLGSSACYTEINVTDNYAPTSVAKVTVTDTSGQPVPDATVRFGLYNYAEFYPIATKRSDNLGQASLRTGLGDILIWATDGHSFGFGKYSVGKDSSLNIVLDKNSGYTGSLQLDIVPPAQSASLPTPTPEAVALNDIRKAREDSIRKSYTDTFFSTGQGDSLARALGLDPTAVSKVLVDSRGNHRTITTFLSQVPASDRQRALDLLLTIWEKDRRDIPADVLNDHLTSTPLIASPLYTEYIMNPRVSNEMLTPYKAPLRAAFPDSFRQACQSDPTQWVKWCADSITIDHTWNPQSLCMSPLSVASLRITDPHSRDIFFVAGARSMGIPARIDPVTGKTQYATPDGTFTDVDFGDTASETASQPKGSLQMAYTPAGRISDPLYYTHFTLSRIDDGTPQLLEYPEGITLSGISRDNKPLDAGQYMSVSGQRMANGNVLARIDIFGIRPDTVNTPQLEIRQDLTGAQVIGSFNSENLYHDLALGTDKSLLSTTGRGYYILGIIAPGNEPTVHALNDISLAAKDLEKWGGKIMLLFESPETAARFDSTRFTSLPSTVTFGTDIDGKIINEISANMKLTDRTLPVFIIADTFNRIIHITQGYTIGLGEQLINILHKAE